MSVPWEAKRPTPTYWRGTWSTTSHRSASSAGVAGMPTTIEKALVSRPTRDTRYVLPS